MKFMTIAEVDATEYFEDEGKDWEFCMKNSTFLHREACEFILDASSASMVKGFVERMEQYGCSKDFIDEFRKATKKGAKKVVFYA